MNQCGQPQKPLTPAAPQLHVLVLVLVNHFTSERYVYIALGDHLVRQYAVGNRRHYDVVRGRRPARVFVFALQNGLRKIHTVGIGRVSLARENEAWGQLGAEGSYSPC